MAYIVVEDFKAGLDTRKLAAASPTGSLQVLSNGHITRGGEIEKRKALVATYALPAGTFGFAGAAGVLYVFGSSPDPGVPFGVTYQQLTHPNGSAMTGVLSTEFFDGQVFVSAAYSDGSSLCFFAGVLVADFAPGSLALNVAGQRVNSLLTVKSKVYAIATSVLNFSAVADAVHWGSGSGYGFINMSNQAAGSETLTAMGRYQNYLAVFSRRNTQIWYVDPDPLQNSQRQVLSGIGTFAPKSVVSYGDADVFFLADSGVRSLRARDASNQANINDVGTSIDDELIAWMATLTDAQKAAAASMVEPVDGRYVLSIGTRAYVFSYYPTSRISAWSSYDLGFGVSDFVVTDGAIWARSGDTIYLYGGSDGQTYDASIVTVTLPYIDARQVATWKEFTGIDLVCEGEWSVYANTDPARPDAESLLAVVNGTTLAGMDIGMVGNSPLIKLRLVNSRAGPAKLSKVVVHYTSTDDEG